MSFLVFLGFFVFTTWACWNLANYIREYFRVGERDTKSVSDAQLRQVLGKRTWKELRALSVKIEKMYEGVKHGETKETDWYRDSGGRG